MKIAQSRRSCAPFIASFAMSGRRVTIVAERGRSDAQRLETLSKRGSLHIRLRTVHDAEQIGNFFWTAGLNLVPTELH
jgi:hypothetical protein